ncbi:MAG: DUF4249 family protein [Saprospiraceae bacterium]
MRRILTISIIIIAGFSCTEEIGEPKFVVEGFIFAGEPVNNIKIKEQIEIGMPDSLENLISNADVVLIKNNIEYALDFDNGKYKYFGNDLAIVSGDNFRLEVTVGDRIASAETVVPQATTGLVISDLVITVPKIVLSFSLIEELTDLFWNARSTVSWDNQNDELHFIVIESVEEEMDPLFPEGFPQNAKDFLSGFKFAPEALEVDSFNIIGIAFDSYGRHRAKVYRVNSEYADLFDNPKQDSRDLTTPPSNIVNGFGIFSAFAADSVFFDIVN